MKTAISISILMMLVMGFSANAEVTVINISDDITAEPIETRSLGDGVCLSLIQDSEDSHRTATATGDGVSEIVIEFAAYAKTKNIFETCNMSGPQEETDVFGDFAIQTETAIITNDVKLIPIGVDLSGWLVLSPVCDDSEDSIVGSQLTVLMSP